MQPVGLPPVVVGASVMTAVEASAVEAITNTTHAGRIEFLGLWRDTGDRAMPIKMGVAPHNPNQVRRAFDALVSDMRRANVSSGILAAQSYNQMHWSADPNEQRYKRHGFIGEAGQVRGD